MFHKLPLIAAVLVPLHFLPAPGAAQISSSAPVAMADAANPESIAAEMQKLGYRAEMTQDGVGDPKINSAAGGSKFQVYFYGCTDGRDCSSIQFVSAFDMPNGLDLSVVNDWNRDHRYSAAHLDSERDPVISMDVAMHGGLPTSLFAKNLAIWEEIIPQFKQQIGW